MQVDPRFASFWAAGASTPLAETLFDDTFAGIHQLSWFDWALLIPYFITLSILAVYGSHRYHTLWTYWRTRRDPAPQPSGRLPDLPRVTIQLPLFNEQFVVERLLEETLKIRYPKERLQIQVLDDSTDETHPFTQALVARYRALGYPIEYHHRTNRHGFKAGALEEGLATATGEFIAIFDADFLPPADFLERTIPYFADPKVGLVQTRWTYLNREYNLLTEVQAMLLDGHFVLEHSARAASGLFFNFNGTAGILRKEMIRDAGGWQHDTLTEDSDLSYRAQVRGWRFVYLPDIECPSELPTDMYSFQVQQARWAKGLTQCAKKLLPVLWRSRIPWRNKVEAFFHLTPNLSYPLMIVVSVLMLPVMIVRFYMGWFEMLLIDFPLILASFWSIAAFYLTAQRILHPQRWWRAIALLPALIAAGVALTLSNTKAVLEALLGVETSFARTPKYAIRCAEPSKIAPAIYRRKSGWLPYVELAASAFFATLTLYAIDTNNLLTIPFLLFFVAGYGWAGIATILEEYRGKIAFEKARTLAAQPD